MAIKKLFFPFLTGLFFLFLLPACNNRGDKGGHSSEAATPEELRLKVTEMIGEALQSADFNKGIFDDSVFLNQPTVVKYIYDQCSMAPVWSDSLSFYPIGDSLIAFIRDARFYGLFPEDYHLKELTAITEAFAADTLSTGSKKDAYLWEKADILLSDAFVQLIKDIKLGRLPNDSITLRKDSVLSDDFFQQQLSSIRESGSVTKVVQLLEPQQVGYRDLKKAVRHFLEKAENRVFTTVPSKTKDPENFKKLLQKRLYESNYIGFDSIKADSSALAIAVKKFQKDNGLTIDGVPGDETIRTMNLSDKEKFIRIAISLDKYKLLQPDMPVKYVWVNVAGYYLEIIENDTIKFSSRIICGKPKTRTPELNSAISALITYPQWMPPSSIIVKEILPAVKKNPGYLAKKGFSLLDSKGEEVDPYSIDWSKYSKSIPYKVVQGSGDENALGIMKFHFDNKYAVYLHDTNQRYLFGLSSRDLSHGCVRVQEWEKLAYYILDNDKIAGENSSKSDSVKTWLNDKKKRNIVIRNKMPVFIRYITCVGKKDGIVFFNDPYQEDQGLREKYFGTK